MDETRAFMHLQWDGMSVGHSRIDEIQPFARRDSVSEFASPLLDMAHGGMAPTIRDRRSLSRPPMSAILDPAPAAHCRCRAFFVSHFIGPAMTGFEGFEP